MVNHNDEPQPMPSGATINLGAREWRTFNALSVALRAQTPHFGVESSLPGRRVEVVHEQDFPNRYPFVLVATDDDSMHKIYQAETAGAEATVAISSALRYRDYSDEGAQALAEVEEVGGLTVPNDQELSDFRVTVNDIAEGMLNGGVRIVNA